jgi:N utilization substance protein A
MVTNELRGERIDVVPFSDDPVEFIQAALQPARVREVRLDDTTGTATVVVSDYQLSLAIGKEGQNARLAARLTGWRVDIKSETQLAEEEAGLGEEWAEGEWVENEAGEMVWQPAEGGEAVSAAEWSRAASAGDQVQSEPEAGGGEQPAPVTDAAVPDAEVADAAVASGDVTPGSAAPEASEVLSTPQGSGAEEPGSEESGAVAPDAAGGTA